jgi:DNA-directed RNA polymerase specialized sigma24 family protein
VARVALADRSAFGRLYAMLSAQVMVDVGRVLPDPTDAVAVTRATFVEVWCLARFHAERDTDVPAWIARIAQRRATDRRSLATRSESGPVADTPQAISSRRWWASMNAIHDRYTARTLSELLGPVR